MDMKDELSRRQRAAWVAFGPLKKVTDHLSDSDHQAGVFDSTVLSAIYYAVEAEPILYPCRGLWNGPDKEP